MILNFTLRKVKYNYSAYTLRLRESSIEEVYYAKKSINRISGI